jgi:tetratricopeptide (TPR) repeat protein
MRQLVINGLIVLSCGLTASPAEAQETSQNKVVCSVESLRNFSPAVRREACSAVIQAETEDTEQLAHYLHLRGVAYFETADYENALTDFSKAIALNPQDDGFVMRGQVYFWLKDYINSVNDLSKSLEYNLSQDVKSIALYYRGSSFYWMSDFESAVKDYTDAIQADRNNGLAFLGRSMAHRERKQYDLALADASRALALIPQDPMAWNQRCWTRGLSERDLHEALADCNEAVRLDPRYANAFDSRALVHFRRQEWDAALADYETAIALAPDAAHQRFGRGLTLLRLGRHEEGAAAIAEAQQLDPSIEDRYAGFGVTP